MEVYSNIQESSRLRSAQLLVEGQNFNKLKVPSSKLDNE